MIRFMFTTSGQIETMSMFSGNKNVKIGAKKLLVEWEKVIVVFYILLLLLLLLLLLFYLPHNNRKWTTSNIGQVEKRSAKETKQKL